MGDFDDLLAANQEYAAAFDHGGFDGIAHAGVAIVTCMDSRIDPLQDARPQASATPRSSATPAAGSPRRRSRRSSSGVHLLNVKRILVVPHTRCAMTANTEEELRDKISASAGTDPAWQVFSVVTDQLAALEDDVRKVRSHPLIPETVAVGGFVYDVDTGLLDQKF